MDFSKDSSVADLNLKVISEQHVVQFKFLNFGRFLSRLKHILSNMMDSK